MLAPRRLAEKLRQIRVCLNLTQAEMVLIVNPYETGKNRARISQYERGKRIPSTVEIFNYAKSVGISTDVLLDDELDLPLGLCRAGRNGKAATIPSAVIDEALNKIILSGESLANDAPVGSIGHRGNGTNIAVAEPPPPRKTENKSSDKSADRTNESVQADGTDKNADKAEEILSVQSKKAETAVESINPADSFAAVGGQAVNENSPSVTVQPPDYRCQTYNPNMIPEKDEIPEEGEICDVNQQRTMPIAEQTIFRLGEVYLELLPLLAHERWSQMSFDIFIEQIIVVGINDYERRKTESAIVCRLRAATNDFTP